MKLFSFKIRFSTNLFFIIYSQHVEDKHLEIDKEYGKKAGNPFRDSDTHGFHQYQLCKLRRCQGISQTHKDGFKNKDRFINT